MRFELEGSTLAWLRQAQDEYRRRTGESAGDDAFVTALVRAYVESGDDTSCGAAAQVMMSLCPTCWKGTADAGSRAVPLAPAEVERLCCHAQVLPTAQLEPVLGRAADGTTSHVGPAGDQADSPVLAEIARRAQLKVATEIRPSILRRHHGRCGVTGCSHRAQVDIHHCDVRSGGGTHDPDRLLPLCYRHHTQVHEGRLLVDCAWSTGFHFRHADGTPYGARAPSAPRIDAAQVAYDVLCKSGFRQGEARKAIDAIRDRLDRDTTLEQAARMAFIAASELPTRRRARRVREARASYRRTQRRSSDRRLGVDAPSGPRSPRSRADRAQERPAPVRDDPRPRGHARRSATGHRRGVRLTWGRPVRESA